MGWMIGVQHTILLLWVLPLGMVFEHSGLCPSRKDEGRNPHFSWEHTGCISVYLLMMKMIYDRDPHFKSGTQTVVGAWNNLTFRKYGCWQR
jgi:hypothetical protein